MFENIEFPNRNIRLAALAGAIATFFLLVIVRYFSVPAAVHYHANFAVFVDGERESFESTLYYEEVQACSAEHAGPRSRVHMHQPDNNIAHIHAEGATWGHLFENLGWSLGNSFMSDGVVAFTGEDNKKLTFILNGDSTKNIANKTINSEDRLLISYGDKDTDVDAQYAQVEDTAPIFNEQSDPAACQGSDEEDFFGRLKRAVLN